MVCMTLRWVPGEDKTKQILFMSSKPIFLYVDC